MRKIRQVLPSQLSKQCVFLWLFAAVCVSATKPVAVAQGTRTLAGQIWVLTYTTGKANSTDYSEYAKITFEKLGKASFDNGETAHWKLTGNKLTVENDNKETLAVHYLQVRINGTSAIGTANLGMNHNVPYWVHLTRIAQASPSGPGRSTCVTTKEAKDLLLTMDSLRSPVRYSPSGGGVYHNLDINLVRRNYPMVNLFYQRGYLTFEYNGTNTFQELTSKGNELQREYPNGIPFYVQSIIAIPKVVCSGNQATVTVLVIARPTQIALDILGPSLRTTRPFGVQAKRFGYLKYANGVWQIDATMGNIIAPIE